MDTFNFLFYLLFYVNKLVQNQNHWAGRKVIPEMSANKKKKLSFYI